MYSVVVENSPDIPGEGKPRRSTYSPSELVDSYPSAKDGKPITTLYENFLEGVFRAGDKKFLGHRPCVDGVFQPYQWQTYNTIKERATNFGAGMSYYGVSTGENFGIYSINRPEWVITELGGYMYNSISVPLYDTLGREAIEYIINQTEMKVIVAAINPTNILFDLIENLPTVKTIIVMDGADNEIVAKGAELGVCVLSFLDVEKKGQENPVELSPPSADDVATISYTSGTTGTPKGALIIHRNVLGTVSSLRALGRHGKFLCNDETDTHFSYLPLAHVLERGCEALMIAGGSRIGFYQGDTLKLMDDIGLLKPTVFVSVPRLLNRIYDKVLAGVKQKGGISEKLFNHAYSVKKANLKSGSLHHLFWDKLVFSSVRTRLGGQIKYIFSASAPLSGDVKDFFRICLSADIYEGYGQTEQSGGLSVTSREDLSNGHVGPPHVCAEVKLRDIPSMDYSSNDKPFPRGEIMVRGPSTFKGYYKSPLLTQETIEADGWMHTGDIGQWDSEGRLRVIDRVKNIFKLAQGEYVAPEKIETILGKHPLIAQIFVHGESIEATLVAVVVPDSEVLLPWAENNGLGDKTVEELCTQPLLHKVLLNELSFLGREYDLKGFEIPKNIYVTSEQFTIENDLLTPTFKLKRQVAKKRFSRELERLYKELAHSS